MERVYLTWHDVEELITKVVMQLNTPYDALLLITRGGIVPGGMIAEALKMKEILTASVVFESGPGVRAEMSWPRFQQFPANAILNGKKVLIVDNIWDRGRTIVTVKSRVQGSGATAETAVLHWKQRQNLFKNEKPDYYAELTEDWIYYPWQRLDDSDDLVSIRHPRRSFPDVRTDTPPPSRASRCTLRIRPPKPVSAAGGDDPFGPMHRRAGQPGDADPVRPFPDA